MAIRGNISLMGEGTQTENFHVTVSFEGDPIFLFNIGNLTIDGIEYAYVSNVESIPSDASESSNWILNVTVNDDVSGDVIIGLQGTVIQGEDEIEIEADPLTIAIDTTTELETLEQSSSTADYSEFLSKGIIKIPVEFSSAFNVVSFTASDVNIYNVVNGVPNTSSRATNVEHYVTGEGHDFNIVVMPDKNIDASFHVRTSGNILYYRTGDKTLTRGTAGTTRVTFAVDSVKPYIEFKDVPDVIDNKFFDVYIGFNKKVSGLNDNSFIVEGKETGDSHKVYYNASATLVFPIIRSGNNITGGSITDATALSNGTLASNAGNGWLTPSNTTSAKFFLLRILLSDHTQNSNINISLKENVARITTETS